MIYHNLRINDKPCESDLSERRSWLINRNSLANIAFIEEKNVSPVILTDGKMYPAGLIKMYYF